MRQIDYASLARQTRARMVMDHQRHIQQHCQEYGAPLGVLRTHPTQRQLDEAFVEFRAEKMVETGQRITEQKKKQAAMRYQNKIHPNQQEDPS